MRFRLHKNKNFYLQNKNYKRKNPTYFNELLERLCNLKRIIRIYEDYCLKPLRDIFGVNEEDDLLTFENSFISLDAALI